MKRNPIRLVPVTEVARRARVCSVTARRRVAAAKLEPDALLIAGEDRSPIPCFVESRLGEIKQIINPR
jgi:hypothetical protein